MLKHIHAKTGFFLAQIHIIGNLYDNSIKRYADLSTDVNFNNPEVSRIAFKNVIKHAKDKESNIIKYVLSTIPNAQASTHLIEVLPNLPTKYVHDDFINDFRALVNVVIAQRREMFFNTKDRVLSFEHKKLTAAETMHRLKVIVFEQMAQSEHIARITDKALIDIEGAINHADSFIPAQPL